MRKAMIIASLVLLTGCSQPPLGADEKVVLTDSKLEAVKSDVLTSYDKIEKIGTSTEMTVKSYVYKTVDAPSSLQDILKPREKNGRYSNHAQYASNTQIIFSGDKYFLDDDNKWKEIKEGTTTKEKWDETMKVSFLDKVLAMLKGVEPAVAQYSGFAASNSGFCTNDSKASWTLARDDATADSCATNPNDGSPYSMYVNSNFSCYRTFMVFDLSSIPGGATVSSSTLNAYWNPYLVGEGGRSTSVVITGASDVSSPNLAVGDFDNFNFSSEFATVADTTLPNGGRYGVVLDADGRSYIATNAGDSATAFTITLSQDYSNTSPSGYTWVIVRFPAYSDTDPYLMVAYTAGSSASVDGLKIYSFGDF